MKLRICFLFAFSIFTQPSFSFEEEITLSLNYMNVNECGIDEFDQRSWASKEKLEPQKESATSDNWCILGYPDSSNNPQIKINGKLVRLTTLVSTHPEEMRFSSSDHSIEVVLTIVANEDPQESSSDNEKCTGEYTDALLTIKSGETELHYKVMNYQGG